MEHNSLKAKMKRIKSIIAIILAVVLCLMNICPALGAESDPAAEAAENAASETDAEEPGDIEVPIETVHSKSFAYAEAGDNAEEEEGNPWNTQVVDFKAVNDDHTLSSKFYYDDRMMLTNANELSTDLAKVSVGLAAAAYIQDDIEQCFSDMNYELLGGQSYNYDRPTTYEDNDFVAYSIGHREIEGHDVYIVAVRGTPKSDEWISDFHLGQGEYHFGFHNSASEIIAKLLEYVSGSDNIFLFTGHSRGAAVANILAGEVTTRMPWASAEHVFAYTFACPAVKYTEDASSMNSLQNIHNYNAPGDVIPELPLLDWGYARYGGEILLPSEGEVFSNFKNRFRQVYDQEFGGKLSTYGFVEAFKAIAATREDFCNISSEDPQEVLNAVEHQFLFDAIGWYLGDKSAATGFAIADFYGLYDLRTIKFFAKRNFVKIVKMVINHSSLLQDSVAEELDENAALFSEINIALDNTDNYSEEQFDTWIENNEELVKKIKEKFDITVEKRTDLIEARDELKDQMDGASSICANLVTLCNLYVSSGGSFSSIYNTVYHNHQQGSYVLWINSMYYGYEGWADNDSVTSMSIPDNIKNIGESCFSGCDNLQTVTVPDSVSNIGSSAFHDCSGLTSVTMPITANYDSGNGASSYGNPASFYNCVNVREIHFTKGIGEAAKHKAWAETLPTIAMLNLTTVTLEQGITEVPDYFIVNCSEVVELVLPDTIKKIGEFAFSGCQKLGPEMKLPSGLETIGMLAFDHCSGLTSIEIRSGITQIPYCCFSNCTGLIEINIPESVTDIGDCAFEYCSALPGIVIPDSVTGIGSLAFRDCTSLINVTMPITACYDCGGDASFYNCSNVREIHYTKGRGEVVQYAGGYFLPYIAATNLTTVTLEEGITEIPDAFLSNCSEVKGIVLPDTIKKIGEYAFYGCQLGPETKLPSGLEMIGMYAFEGCRGLTSIIIPSGVTQIPVNCFSNCTGVTQITIPESVTKIGSCAFEYCSSLPEIVIPDSVTSIDTFAFRDCTGLTSVTMPITADYSCDDNFASFSNCSNVREIHYTKGRGEVMQYAGGYFLSHIAASNLTTVTFEEGITEIPDSFLNGCSEVEGIVLPDTIKKIGEYAFQGCQLGPETDLPSGLDTIGEGAFEGCSGLTSIEIPSGITQIPDSCFRDCTGLAEIIISEGVTGIGNYAFHGCSALPGIIIPDGVTHIGDHAFYGCSGVTELVISDSVSDIGTVAFSGCTGLTSVTLPISTDYNLGNSGFASDASFYNCANVEEIHYTKGNGEVMHYENYGYYGNSLPCIAGSNLRTVTLEEGITEIPDNFLIGCSGINTVNLPFSINTISSQAFHQCTGLSDVYFNGSEMEAGGILIEDYNAALNSATWHYAQENPNEELTLKLPGQLKVVEEEAFTGMSAEVIIIPATVETIKSGAFEGCADLKTIIFEGSPQSIENKIVTNPDNVTVFVIKDSDTEAWARESGFRVKYNLKNN